MNKSLVCCSECERMNKEIEKERKLVSDANREMFPELIQALQLLRPVLSRFRDNNFAGVPCAHQLTIWHHYYPASHESDSERVQQPASFIKLIGKWMQPLGFMPGEKVRLLAFKGILILCPADFKEGDAFLESLKAEQALLPKIPKQR